MAIWILAVAGLAAVVLGAWMLAAIICLVTGPLNIWSLYQRNPAVFSEPVSPSTLRACLAAVSVTLAAFVALAILR